MASNLKNQQFLSQTSKVKLLSKLSPLDEEITIDQINDMPKNLKTHLQALMRLRAKYPKDIFPSLDSLAAYTGRCRRAVQNYNTHLKELGLLTWRRGYIGRANNYVFNSLFDSLNVRRGLRFVIRSFFFMPLSLLMGLNASEMTTSGNADQIYVFDGRANYKEIRNKGINNLPNPPTPSTPKPKVGQRPKGRVYEKVKTMQAVDLANVESLNLTERGKIILSIFPTDIADEALATIRAYKSPIKDLGSFVFAFCMKRCRDRGLEVPLREAIALTKERGLSITDPLVQPDKPYIMRSKNGKETLTSAAAANARTDAAYARTQYRPAPEHVSRVEDNMEKMKALATNPFMASIVADMLKAAQFVEKIE